MTTKWNQKYDWEEQITNLQDELYSLFLATARRLFDRIPLLKIAQGKSWIGKRKIESCP